MIHEYPLDGKPPMMTHVFENKEGKRIIAAKAVQKRLCIQLSTEEQQQIQDTISLLASKGYRILGVGYSNYTETNYPQNQQDLSFHFRGLGGVL
jgi:Ca2+-transporting ATPase